MRSDRLLLLLVIAVVFVASASPAAAYTFDSVGLYQSFDEMTAWAAALEAANPDLVTVVEFGRSHQDRPLLAIQLTTQPSEQNHPGRPEIFGDPGRPEIFGDPGRPEIFGDPGRPEFFDDPGRPGFRDGPGSPEFLGDSAFPAFLNDPGKPEFLFTGGVHAREVIGSESSYRLAEYLVDSYRAGSPATIDILANREVWIVPTMNPDGRIRVEDGFNRQRKNMELIPGQSSNPNSYQRGVDLNRNFPHRWSEASNSIYSETYRGPSELSAPEASALWDLLHNEEYFSDMLGAIDFHSGAETILMPWISPRDFRDNPLPQEDREKFDFLADNLGALTGLPDDRLNYEAYGTLADSFYEEFGAYAMVEELYKGPFTDYFRLFNPLNQPDIDTAVARAIDSSMFLLSDQAFAFDPDPAPGFDSSTLLPSDQTLAPIPEPATWLLMLLATAWLMLLRRRLP